VASQTEQVLLTIDEKTRRLTEAAPRPIRLAQVCGCWSD